MKIKIQMVITIDDDDCEEEIIISKKEENLSFEDMKNKLYNAYLESEEFIDEKQTKRDCKDEEDISYDY